MNRLKRISIIPLCFILMLAFAFQVRGAEGLKVHFINVGQGDAQLIQCGDEAMLIDGGSREMSQVMYAFLKDQGVDHLKYIIATHPDADHVAGLAGALNYAGADYAFCSVSEYDSKSFENFRKYLGTAELTVPEAGTELYLGDADIQIWSPSGVYEETNNNSLVIKIVYGSSSFLFTGDAQTEEEYELLYSGFDLSADVLKVGHHGSSSSTGPEFLRAVSPSCAVISCGQENTYRHPADETLRTLKEAGVTLYRTDMQGHLLFESDGASITVRAQNNPYADTFMTYDQLYGSLQSDTSQPETVKGASQGNVHIYILNTNSKKIHTEGCKSVKQMKDKNKLKLEGTLDDIMAEYSGYTVCGNCHAAY